MTESFENRFWSKIVLGGPEDCWIWTAATKVPGGYGRIRFNGVMVLAHRVAYELANGSIPDGKNVLHSCDVPPCCNPAHLWIGTPLDNARDRDMKGRKNPLQGERHGSAILTRKQVLEILELRGSGLLQREIGVLYGVDHATISDIHTGRSWQHLDSGSVA